MPFLRNYKEAMKLLSDIEKGKCSGTCKSSWIRNLKYALKTKTNPLKLTTEERKTMTSTIKNVSSRRKKSISKRSYRKKSSRKKSKSNKIRGSGTRLKRKTRRQITGKR
jgi:hypothetical protein